MTGVEVGVEDIGETVRVGGKAVGVGEGIKMVGVVVRKGEGVGAGEQEARMNNNEIAARARFINICQSMRGETCTWCKGRCSRQASLSSQPRLLSPGQ